MLKDAPCLAYLVDVVGEDDVMGVAHRDEGALVHIPACHKLLFVLKDWFLHVDGDALDLTVLYMQFQRLNTREREQAVFDSIPAIAEKDAPLWKQEGEVAA